MTTTKLRRARAGTPTTWSWAARRRATRPNRRWRPLAAALLLLATLAALLAPAPAHAQSIDTIRQPPRVDSSISARTVANDGTTRTVLVSVSASTVVPDALTEGDPFTGFGNFEITLDFPKGRVSGAVPPTVTSGTSVTLVDTTFCAPGVASCEVNPDEFLTAGQSLVFTLAIVTPCPETMPITSTVTARPDGYARPDAESTAATVSNGETECDPPVIDDTPRNVLPSPGIPVGGVNPIEPVGGRVVPGPR